MKTDPQTPEQTEWLQHYEAALSESPAVTGFLIFNATGGLLAESLSKLPGAGNLEEVSSWVQNLYHAVDSYYPEAKEAFLRFAQHNVVMCRDHDLIAVVVLDPSYELKSFNDLLNGERLKRLASKLRAPTSGPKKSETVFLKISQEGEGGSGTSAPMSGGTQSPMPNQTPAPMGGGGTPAPFPTEPPKKGGNMGIIIGVVAAVVVIAGGAFFALQGGQDETTPPPVVNDTPARVDDRTQSLELRLQVESLGQLANELKASEVAPERFASATAVAGNAERSFNQGNYADAVKLFTEARSSLGAATLSAAQAQFSEAEGQLRVENPRNYSSSVWLQIDEKLAAVESLVADNQYAQAVLSVQEATALLAEVKASLPEEILQNARNAVANADNATATYFYEQLLLLQPENEEALQHIWSGLPPGETITNSVGMELAFIPAGTYTRGTPESERLRDRDEVTHEVTITEGFFISTTEVTQAQWSAVMGQPFVMPDEEPGFIGDTLPVHSVSWYQAQEFCAKLTEIEGKPYRLPTEAEWEYAARAGTATAFNTGSDSLSWREANIYDPNGDVPFAPVAVGTTGAPNAWNLYDIHGNVWEWTQDWFGPYPTEAVTDPQGPGQDSFTRIDLAMKALRGGSFNDDPDKARSGNRWEYSPSVGTNYIGFRVVQELGTTEAAASE